MKIFSFLKQFPKDVRRFAFFFSLSRFMLYFNFFWLIQNIYFLESGINYTQLSIILALWSVGVIVLEIPSGIFADKFGRKLTIVISRIAYLLGLFIFVLYPFFWGFVLGIVVWSIHESFMSGSEEALLYDFLKERKKEYLFNKILVLSTVAREVGLGVGVLIAGFVTEIGVNFNLAGSVIIASIGILPPLFLHESKKRFSVSQELKYLDFFKSAVQKIKVNKDLQRILLFTITTVLSYSVVTEYFTVSLHRLDIPFSYIGVLVVVESMFFAIGGYISHKIPRGNYSVVYVLLTVLMSVFLVVVGLGTIISVILGYLILRSIKAVAEIVSLTDWQNRVDSRDRATSTSFISFSSNTFYIILAFVFGKSADNLGLFGSFNIIAVYTLLFLFFNYLLKRQTMKINNVQPKSS